MQPIQLILFGSPGTGKSHRVRETILPKLGISENDTSNSVRTVFHPEYTYGDFMGKLLPLTIKDEVVYRYYAGSFLKAVAKAYKNILESKENPQHVALVIDEINRGNSAAIFGTGFQLLDRDLNGWSIYEIDISVMEFDKILELMDIYKGEESRYGGRQAEFYEYKGKKYFINEFKEFLNENFKISLNQIRIPSNLSIIATMNTSDSSIYYMDSAFKRRWDWQYIDTDSTMKEIPGDAFSDRASWNIFVDKLNYFIKSQYQYVRKAEDKQIGYYFIQTDVITKTNIQNKVMFFLWDSVFTTSKKPLIELLDLPEDQVVTFGDFANQVEDFINKISAINY